VRNVEDAGAALAIIIDNKSENVEMVNMVDDGAGAGIRIPSMIISRKDGDTLVEYIRSEQRDTQAAQDYESKRRGETGQKEDEPLENPCGGKEGDEKEECEADFAATKAEKERLRKRERDAREKDRQA